MRQETNAEYLEFFTPDEIRLKGHRIWLEHIVARARQGMSAADIVADLPTLTLDEVQAVLSYIAANRSEVDAYMERHAAYIAEQERFLASASASPVIQRLQRLRDHLKAQGILNASPKLSHT